MFGKLCGSVPRHELVHRQDDRESESWHALNKKLPNGLNMKDHLRFQLH